MAAMEPKVICVVVLVLSLALSSLAQGETAPGTLLPGSEWSTCTASPPSGIRMMAFIHGHSETRVSSPAKTCQVEPHQRRNCGDPGITAKECKDKGCCFDNTVRGVPWCFHTAPVVDEACEF